jgi:phage N-6-adenine-methyltransferase
MNRHEPMLAEDDVRETPPELFTELNREFRFTLDVCATHENAKCSIYFTEQGCFEQYNGEVIQGLGGGDGLTGSWKGERAWCNPPFSDIESWVGKAWDSEAELVVMLIPSTRTEQGWWQDLVEPYRDGNGDDVAFPAGDWTTFRVRFLRGRPKFLKNGVKLGSPKFGCCLLIWEK